jgi:hypothetical protein
MILFHRDTHFSTLFDELVNIKDDAPFLVAARELEHYVLSKGNPFLAFRLALELDDRGYKTSRLESFVIKSRDNNYILRFARFIKRANVVRLQEAIIKFGSTLHIAKFGCFVRGADKRLIEDIIVEHNHPKSAYLFIKYVKVADINRLKSIILGSKRPRYLYALARVLRSKKELDAIQEMIIAGKSDLYVRLFAANIQGADIERLEERIIQTRDINEMRRFARAVKSERIEKLCLLF